MSSNKQQVSYVVEARERGRELWETLSAWAGEASGRAAYSGEHSSSLYAEYRLVKRTIVITDEVLEQEST